jgi:2,4-dienoyl-CoA reductase-like NADH-dependent reductase (Old Yellow Enzyme family)
MSFVFEPIWIGGTEIKNRFVHSATHEALAAQDGTVTEPMIRRYKRLAEGDIGLILPGHLFVEPRGRANPRQAGIHCDAMIPGLKKLVDTVHAHGGKIALQLAHGGRQSPGKIIGQAPVAPSGGGRDPVSLARPVPMDEAQIIATIAAFAEGARRALRAGADAVQLHAAHGYLINQFLSPFYNRRNDGWGGCEQGRFRFLKETVAQVRNAVSDEIPVIVKLNVNDFIPNKGITPDLAATYARWLAEAGVAAVEISCGTFYNFQTIRGDIPGAQLARALPLWMRPAARLKMKLQGPAHRFKHAYNLAAAQVIKPVLKGTPLMLVGGLRTLSQMEEIVAAGTADMICMSRPFIRQPGLVRRFREGTSTAALCTSCNRCFAAMFNAEPIRCYHGGRTPQTGRQQSP